MEHLEQQGSPEFNFYGKGSKFFGIAIVNFLLTYITLGLYYPWAKCAIRKYLWGETEFDDSAFTFHGTGKEMFRGFIIAYGILLLCIACFFINPIVAIGVFLIAILILPALAIFGAWRYRVTRTSWRGIYFTFDGDFREFLNMYVPQMLLTIVTFGIYGAWMRVKLQRYLFEHTQFGQLRLGFTGQGSDLFVINLVGFFLMYPTLFLYVPIFMKKRFNFTIDHTYLDDGETKAYLDSILDNGTAFKVLFTNGLLVLFTAGLGFPWALMRTMRMYFEHVIMPEEFDYNALEQQPGYRGGAVGDEMADILDVGLDF
ncbi:MAG: DUF898 domain-containing protein [Saprospiraceae bacterium]|nr:DUF898 domain-containing protein [Saprospiraceae bacterium]